MTEKNRASARRWFEEVWNKRREATIDELADPLVLIHGLGEGGRDLIGPEGFRRFFRAFCSAFPDFHVTVDDVLADGEKTATRITFTGTHTGDGLGIPPTGRRVRSTGIIICRWKSGRIIEGWNEFDAAGMMQQLQPPPGTLKLRA